MRRILTLVLAFVLVLLFINRCVAMATDGTDVGPDWKAFDEAQGVTNRGGSF